MSGARKLVDDCFVHDDQRMRHDDVLALLAERLAPVTAIERVSVMQAGARIAAADVAAAEAIPRSDNAAVDGFAFEHNGYLARDGRLDMTGTLAAGDRPARTVRSGACVQIFTGAAMPEGADTVVMQEDCTMTSDGVICVPPGLKKGANRRRRGEDFIPGDKIIKQDRFLRAQDLAALAAHGHAQVLVRKKLGIGILSTGNEIIEPGRPAGPAQVHDANRPMLMALARSPSTNVTDLGHVPDDPSMIEQCLTEAAAQLDLIITTGGASRGGEDHMLDIIDTIGRRHVWQIAIKPGRPMMFGQIDDTVIMGLPGNPVAVLVCFALYATAVIAHLAGAHWTQPVALKLPAAFDIARKKPGRREFARGWTALDDTTGTLQAHKFARDGSGLISGLQAATGLIDLHEDATRVERGDRVAFLPFSQLLLPGGIG